MIDEKTLTVDFSGTAIIEAKRLLFSKVDSLELIDGNEWLQLSEEEREDYVINSFVDMLACSDDVCEFEINIEE